MEVSWAFWVSKPVGCLVVFTPGLRLADRLDLANAADSSCSGGSFRISLRLRFLLDSGETEYHPQPWSLHRAEANAEFMSQNIEVCRKNESYIDGCGSKVDLNFARLHLCSPF